MPEDKDGRFCIGARLGTIFFTIYFYSWFGHFLPGTNSGSGVFVPISSSIQAARMGGGLTYSRGSLVFRHLNAKPHQKFRPLAPRSMPGTPMSETLQWNR